jgi:hypothetical protein
MVAVQGHRVRVIDRDLGRLGGTLFEAMAPRRRAITAFADASGLRLQIELAKAWADAFPMVLVPEADDGSASSCSTRVRRRISPSRMRSA